MIARSELVKHSLLSFASGYFLDLTPVKHLQDRANLHYKRAVSLLSSALQEVRRYQTGEEEALVASIVLLMGDDVRCHPTVPLKSFAELCPDCELGIAPAQAR